MAGAVAASRRRGGRWAWNAVWAFLGTLPWASPLPAQAFYLQVEGNLREFTIAPHGTEASRPAMPAIPFRLTAEADLAATTIQWMASTSYTTRQCHPLHLHDSFKVTAQGPAYPPDLFRHPLPPYHPARGGAREVVRGGQLEVHVLADLSQVEGKADLGLEVEELDAFLAGTETDPGPAMEELRELLAGPALQVGPTGEYLDDLKVRLGEQPDPARVLERLVLVDETLPDGTVVPGNLLTRWIRAIAAQESHLHQNAVADDPGHFQAVGEPFMSRNGDGGIGIMQRTPSGLERMTKHYHIQDWLWDWTANVAEGLRLFREEKLRDQAFRYPAKVEACPGFDRAVAATNRKRQAAGRPPLGRIRVPSFSAEQLVQDAVRGYNGYAGKDPFGLALHEFRLKTARTDFGTVLETTQEGPAPDRSDLVEAWAVWETVPATDRPEKKGDRGYVEHVRTRLDQPGNG